MFDASGWLIVLPVFLCLIVVALFPLLPAGLALCTRRSFCEGYRSFFDRLGWKGTCFVALTSVLASVLAVFCLASTFYVISLTVLPPNAQVFYRVTLGQGAIHYQDDPFHSTYPTGPSWSTKTYHGFESFGTAYMIMPELNRRYSCTSYGHAFPLIYPIGFIALPGLCYGFLRFAFITMPVEGRCASCGYDLRGSVPGASCPECGAQGQPASSDGIAQPGHGSRPATSLS